MKIVHISISNNVVPPQGYGGTERIVHWLSSAQIQKGHDVYVVAPEGGENEAKNIPIPLWSTEEEMYEMTHKKIIELKPDIVHDHTFSQLFRRNNPKIPALSTFHNNRFHKVPNTVYPTKAGAKINFSNTSIHHGLAPEDYDYSEEKENYLLFIGAIHPNKNLDLVIKVAKKTNIPLIIVGPVAHPRYFCKKIRKQLSGNIIYRDAAFGHIKKHYLSKAKAVCYFSTSETFGISLIEAMVSGTPVITSDIPAFHEVVNHGKTGFICKEEKGVFKNKINNYVKAVEELGAIQPNECRKWVVDNFTNGKMAERYEELYVSVMNGNSW